MATIRMAVCPKHFKPSRKARKRLFAKTSDYFTKKRSFNRLSDACVGPKKTSEAPKSPSRHVLPRRPHLHRPHHPSCPQLLFIRTEFRVHFQFSTDVLLLLFFKTNALFFLENAHFFLGNALFFLETHIFFVENALS